MALCGEVTGDRTDLDFPGDEAASGGGNLGRGKCLFKYETRWLCRGPRISLRTKRCFQEREVEACRARHQGGPEMTNRFACSHPIAQRILAHSHTNGEQLCNVRDCENTRSELVTGQQTFPWNNPVYRKGWEWMILIEGGRLMKGCDCNVVPQ